MSEQIYSFSQRKKALEQVYDDHNLVLWKIIYGNLQDELHAERIITRVFKDVWDCDEVLFTKERQLIFILRFCKNRLNSIK